jgi:hypothetical protein
MHGQKIADVLLLVIWSHGNELHDGSENITRMAGARERALY